MASEAKMGWLDKCRESIILTPHELRAELENPRGPDGAAGSFADIQREKLNILRKQLNDCKEQVEGQLAITSPHHEAMGEKIYYRFANSMQDCRSAREVHGQSIVIPPDVDDILLHLHTTTNQKQLEKDNTTYYSPYLSTTSNPSDLAKTSLGLTGVGDENMKTVLNKTSDLFVFKVIDNGKNIKYPPPESAMCYEEGECALDTRIIPASSCLLAQIENPFKEHIHQGMMAQMTQRDIPGQHAPAAATRATALDAERKRIINSEEPITEASIQKYEALLRNQDAFERSIENAALKPKFVRDIAQSEILFRRQKDSQRRLAPPRRTYQPSKLDTFAEVEEERRPEATATRNPKHDEPDALAMRHALENPTPITRGPAAVSTAQQQQGIVPPPEEVQQALVGPQTPPPAEQPPPPQGAHERRGQGRQNGQQGNEGRNSCCNII